MLKNLKKIRPRKIKIKIFTLCGETRGGDHTIKVWRDYGTPEFKKQFRPKDTRGLGLTRENWEEITGKKRKASLKTSNKNVTIL